MRYGTILLLAFLLGNICYSQSLRDEYKGITPHDESTRLDHFVGELRLEPESTGFIIIYLGDDFSRVGNIRGYIESVRTRFDGMGFDKDRVKFKVSRGKTNLLRRIWIAEKGDAEPENLKMLQFVILLSIK